MKKLISLLLIAAMMASVCAGFSAFAADPAGNGTHGYMLGDADDDAGLTMRDVLLTRRYISGNAKEKEISLLAADANLDESVTMRDVLTIRGIIAGNLVSDGNNVDSLYRVDTVTVGGKNISRYTILIPEDTDDTKIWECVNQSAIYLSQYINRACGIALNITTNEAAAENGYVIKYAFDTEDEYSLGKEGFVIDVNADGNLYLTCGSMRGPLYCTWEILEQFIGYRFMPTTKGKLEYLYEADNADIPMGLFDQQVPVIEYRAVAQDGSNEENFIYLRDNSCDGTHYTAKAEYGWAMGTLWEHAHSYENQCGISWQEQPCLTDEKTYEQIMSYSYWLIEDRIANWGKVLGHNWTQLSVSPNDNTNFCSCANCKRIYELEGSIGGTVFRLSNRVAEALAEDYPDIEIFTIAYWDARNPPKMTRPHDNICVCFCVGGCNNHAYNNTEACAECGGNPRLSTPDVNGNPVQSSNVEDMKCLEQWSNLTDNLYTWYYSCNFTYWLAGAPNLFNVYDDFKTFAEFTVKGVYSEGSYSDPCSNYSFEHLRAYLISKMLWNPYMSEEEFNTHLNEALYIYYGDGWQYVREYIEMDNASSDELGCWTNNFDRPFNMHNEEYFKENYHKMAELFDKALALAEGAQYDKLKKASLQCHWLGLSATYERDYANGDAESRAEYERRYTDLYNYIVENNIRLTGFQGDTWDSHGCGNFPQNGEIMNPLKWIYEDFTGYWKYSDGRWI